MRAAAFLLGLLPGWAAAQACPAATDDPLWLQSACELAGAPVDFGQRLAGLEAEWGETLGEDEQPWLAFWTLQQDGAITFVAWGDLHEDLPGLVAGQVTRLGAKPLTGPERGQIAILPGMVDVAGQSSQALLLDALEPVLARRGLAALLLDAGGDDIGIAVVTGAFACRWQGVEIARSVWWTGWEGEESLFDPAQGEARHRPPRDCDAEIS